MPFKNLGELPSSVAEVLPPAGRELYAAAHNCAWEQYRRLAGGGGPGSREDMAERAAWLAVSRVFRKDPATGRWERRPDL